MEKLFNDGALSKGPLLIKVRVSSSRRVGNAKQDSTVAMTSVRGTVITGTTVLIIPIASEQLQAEDNPLLIAAVHWCAFSETSLKCQPGQALSRSMGMKGVVDVWTSALLWSVSTNANKHSSEDFAKIFSAQS